ncbi:MAG TPA: hypothetical protein VF079_03800 [Sphingomicrobium sp.]
MHRAAILTAAAAVIAWPPCAVAKPVIDNEPHLYLADQILGGRATGKSEQLLVQSWHWGPRQSTARSGAADMPKELQAQDRMGDPASARGHSMLGASDRTVIHDPPPPRDGGLGSESELTTAGPPVRGTLTVKASLPGCMVGARYGGAQFASGSMRYELKDVVISNCAPGEVTLQYGKVTVKGWNPEKKEL